MKFSLITINYNNAQGLEKTISSVLNQNKLRQDEFEYIIIDGGSTDGSIDVIKKFNNSNYPQKITKWISEKDNGIYNAINKGITLSTGTIIGLLNSGDEALPNAYDDIISIHTKYPETIIYGGMNMYRNGKFEYTYAFNADDLNVQMISHPGAFVPKCIYEKYGLYDESYRSSADWDLFLNFKEKGVSFLYTSKIYLNFDKGGISNTNKKLVIREDNIIKRKYKLITKKERFKKVYENISFFIPKIFLLPLKILIKYQLKK